MRKNNYKLSPTKSVQYVQKGTIAPRASFLKKIWLSQGLLTVLALVVLGVLAYPLVKNYSKQQAIAQEIREMEAEIEAYEDQNANLKEMLSYLESDQAVEERGRLNLGLKKQGEKVVVIQEATKIVSDSQASSGPDLHLTNPQKWWRYFFR